MVEPAIIYYDHILRVIQLGEAFNDEIYSGNLRLFPNIPSLSDVGGLEIQPIKCA
jgi:hypothetical protein